MDEVIDKMGNAIYEIVLTYGYVHESKYIDNWKFIMGRLENSVKEKLEDLEETMGKKLEKSWEVYSMALYWGRRKSELALRAILQLLIKSVIIEILEICKQ